MTKSTQTIPNPSCKCFCGKDAPFAKQVADHWHFACSENHFSYSVDKKGELAALSARLNETTTLSWYKEMDFFKLIIDNKKVDTKPIVSSVEELKLFCASPVEYIQNYMILS